MYYDFVKKQAVDVLASVTHFVDGTGNVTPKASAEDCSVVELFEDGKLFVAQPIATLGRVCISCMHDRSYPSGKMLINGNTHHFSIQKCGTLYIGRELY